MVASTNCDRRNPLQRDGTHQAGRLIPALSPAYFRVDERDTADLILFAERFSRHLRYYNADNNPDGDWSPFFSRDVSAVLAGLSELPVGAFQAFGRALEAYLAAEPARDLADLRAHFRLAFYLPLLLLNDVGGYFDRLPREHPMRSFVLTLLARDAAGPLADLVGYYQGAIAVVPQVLADAGLNPADYNTTFVALDPRIQLPWAVTSRIPANVLLSGLPLSADMIAPLAPAGWTSFYNDPAIVVNTAPYEDAVGSPHELYQQIYDALHYNLLARALERLFGALERIRQEAAAHLQASLTAFAGHTPHYGLWLAFLRLLEANREHLNTLTGRHLDYYYREVLQLRPLRPQGDRVFLLVELNKNVQEHLLPAATTFFRGGKDATGKEVLYRLDADFVANRAQVAALKALRLVRAGTVAKPQLLPYAAAVANSRDGQGQALPKDDPQWPPFGPTEARALEPGSPPVKLSANGRVGFAVADRRLFLREGTRTITLQITPGVPFGSQVVFSGLRASLTGEKGWVHFSAAPKLSVKGKPGEGLVVQLTLDGADPAIVPYDPALHSDPAAPSAPLPTAAPVLQVTFDFPADPAAGQAAAGEALHALRDLTFTSMKLTVEAADVRNFSLQNEAGVLDAAKPFLPFGPAPAPNASLILGSSELFSKRLEQIKLHLEWEQQYFASAYFLKTARSDYKLGLRVLSGGQWQSPAGQGEIALFSASSSRSHTITLSAPNLAPGTADQTPDNPPYTAQSRDGFLKLILERDFGHSKYVDEKTRALIVLATKGTWQPNSSYNYTDNIPNEPYTPRIVGMTLSYRTIQAAPAQFFHLHPFGFVAGDPAGGRLFPALSNEGELYIGVQDLLPPQRLALLFHVVDGTANPLKPPAALRWHYLSGDTWQELAEQDVADGTENLTRSGIVGIAVPEAADADHAVLPGGLRWFRVSVGQGTDAVNNLLSIAAQAVSATFVDGGNDPAFLATPLPAGTISKLKTADPAVKKVIQPAASFGGAPLEPDDRFYARASERLRHKDRAVTMWDYEHLVLEHFPNIYKVKCINHTELRRDSTQTIVADNEVRPGHVVVVTVPNLRSNPHSDPLRPYTDQRTLVAVDQFLRQRLSPFVRLEVVNPKFEEVQVKFKVSFVEDIADTAFYLAELERAIIRYLCPWAYDEAASGLPPRDISFGGRWHKSAIINFVEEQPYVDFVKDFEMYHKVDIAQPDTAWNRVDEEVVAASTARSILVSHAHHIISEV